MKYEIDKIMIYNMFIALIVILIYDIIIVQSISNMVYHLTISNYIYEKFLCHLPLL